MTQEQFGSYFGLTKSAIVNYEAGIRKIPIDVLYQMAMFHNVTIDNLICKKPTFIENVKTEIEHAEFNSVEEDAIISFIKSIKSMHERRN